MRLHFQRQIVKRILFVLPLGLVSTAFASPCTGIDRVVSKEWKAELEPVLAKQLNLPSVELLQSYKHGGWTILYLRTGNSDEPFLFFRADPRKSKYVTEWSGAARQSEGKEIEEWAIKNAPGIPKKLASCFAWHVTQDRDM